MTFPLAPMEAVSSQRSGEIKPKAGITIANKKGQFAPTDFENWVSLQLEF